MTLFSRRDDFESSTNSGFFSDKEFIYFRQDELVQKAALDSHGIPCSFPSSEMKAVYTAVSDGHSYLFGPVEE